ncbi:hypothetical protein [Tumidithrix elongata]
MANQLSVISYQFLTIGFSPQLSVIQESRRSMLTDNRLLPAPNLVLA